MFKVVYGLAPTCSYLSELLEAYVPRRMLRSSTQLLLREPINLISRRMAHVPSLFVHLDCGIVFL